MGLCLPVGLWAQGNLLITPVRVIFEKGKSNEDINLTNIGRDTAVYVVSYQHYRMATDGSFTELSPNDTTVKYADANLRIFPRRVVLPPNESQTIRLQYRRSADMRPREIRSHLYFRADKGKGLLGMPLAGADSTKMAVRITPVFGISIPVIVRIGSVNATVQLAGVELKNMNDSATVMQVEIHRSGMASVYGDIKVVYKPLTGKEVVLATANGVGVYTEIDKRKFSVVLSHKNRTKLKQGKLIITYRNAETQSGNELARLEYQLPD